MEFNILTELSLIILIAIVIVGITRLLKQPIILGYIITGIVVSPRILNFTNSTAIIETFSQIGIVLILFITGLHLNPKIIKEVGKVSLLTGIGQVIFTTIIGFFIARTLEFSIISSIYLAIAVSFSSTIIITKLLADKNDIEKLYGKISIGFLIVQDLIAIIILMVISSFSANSGSFSSIAIKTFLSGAFLVTCIFAIGFFVLPKLTKSIAKSQEYLLLFSFGWALIVSALFEIFNFSIEIGALLAGITLSLSPYRFEISSKLKPLQDFFIFAFFIWLGLQMNFGNITSNIPIIIALSLLILIGNPIIVIILMGLLRYKKQTGFQAGLTVAQISEFSLILIALGVKVGHVSSDILSIMTVIGVITIAGSSYMIIYSHKIYPIFAKMLTIFERKSTKEELEILSKKYEIIMFGSKRTGYNILQSLTEKKKNLLIVDYNPEIIEKLTEKGYNCIYGDVSDPDLLSEIDICYAKTIISTVQELESNILLIKRTRLCNPNATIIATSDQAKEALKLYDSGADYVILPHHLGGKYASKIISESKFSKEKFEELKKEEIPEIKKLLMEE